LRGYQDADPWKLQGEGREGDVAISFVHTVQSNGDVARIQHRLDQPQVLCREAELLEATAHGFRHPGFRLIRIGRRHSCEIPQTMRVASLAAGASGNGRRAKGVGGTNGT